MTTLDTVQFQATPNLKHQLEAEAARLNLTLSAYIFYLHERLSPNQNTEELDDIVKEVFGKHGELIRRLAK